MDKLQVSYNKTLKLTNALICEPVNGAYQSAEQIVYQMDNYILAKGAQPVGPVVQCMTADKGKDGRRELRIQIIRQTDHFIPNTEQPYAMEEVLRCRDCLFVRFSGKEEQLRYAYDKVNLISFEEDIPLTGRVYTVFTGQSEELFTADVFAEKDMAEQE